MAGSVHEVMTLKNLTPGYISYLDEIPKGMVLEGNNLEYFFFTKQVCMFEGISAVGWFPEEGKAIIRASKLGRKTLSKELRGNTWTCVDGRKIRVDILPEES